MNLLMHRKSMRNTEIYYEQVFRFIKIRQDSPKPRKTGNNEKEVTLCLISVSEGCLQ